MSILSSLEKIGDFVVQNLIKANLYTETYKVSDKNGNLFFLKMFDLNKLPLKLINAETGSVFEIEFCHNLKHKNLVSFILDGVVEKNEGRYQYYVTNYFNGRILSDVIRTEGKFGEKEAIDIFKGILDGLSYLHSNTPILCHNDLDVSNVIISSVQKDQPIIIDLGHLSKPCNGLVCFDTADLNLLYHANETMSGIFDEQGDVFSACVILYTMLVGQEPWNISLEIQSTYKETFKELWAFRRSNPLNLDELQVSDKVKYILKKGLELKPQNRFKNIDEIISIINADNIDICTTAKQANSQVSKESRSEGNTMQEINKVDIEIKRGGGNGFEDIAGMQDLKDYLQQKVIFVIKNEEIAKKYRLSPPNGMLLYGPPGCGKTFFAEKFAEETGFNYMLVKSSDVGSSYHHGTQEKIKKLFERAEKNKPIVLCFDEFDALVPDRNTTQFSYVSQEVNEFLSQMNNCSKRGIFIVATSNRPDKIDPAVLRTGRIDKQVYVPLPDLDARKEMFKMYLNNRPTEVNLDYDTFAELTDGYIASDIAFIVNDAAMTAAFVRNLITNDLMFATIRSTKPSLHKDTLSQYGNLKKQMDNISRRVIVETL